MALDVPVRVGSGAPGWPPLTLVFRRLVVPNPPGFRDEPALSVGRVSVRLTARGLSGDPLVIEEIRVSDATVRIDAKGGRTNLRALHDRATGAAGGASGRRVVIRHVRVSGARATASAPGIGGPRFTVPIRDFELHDVGGRDGATSAELADVLLKLVEPSAGNALRHADPIGAAGAAAGKAAEAIKRLFH